MRVFAIPLLALALTCSQQREEPVAQTAPTAPAGAPSAQPAPVVHFAERPTLEQAIALEPLPIDEHQSQLTPLLARRPDYIATINTERPVSHHSYLYERRRSGHWLAHVYRQGDGANEEISYGNLRTGASFTVRRNDAGEITTLWVAQTPGGQRANWELPQEPTSETGSFLGERCTIWRAPTADTPGVQSLSESCLTDDGVQLWEQRRVVGHPRNPPYTTGRVEVASISRGRIAPNLARPPREIFEWSFWRERAARVAASVSGHDTPPDHTIWYESEREAEQGNVIRAQYRDNVRMHLSHQWYRFGATREFAYEAPGLRMNARMRSGLNPGRELSISISSQPLRWRPDPAVTQRDPMPEVILHRRCFWTSLRNPPEDGFSRACWTDDGYVLAQSRAGRGGASGESAVRLNETRPTASLTPPREFFDWMRALAE